MLNNLPYGSTDEQMYNKKRIETMNQERADFERDRSDRTKRPDFHPGAPRSLSLQL
jgi:hypothetical protein